MPPSLLDQLTPRVSLRTRLLTAACLWSLMGVWLGLKGLLLGQAVSWLLLFFSLVLGLLKSYFVLDKVARQIIAHGQRKKGRVCLGGLFPLQNWLLIAAMIALGRILTILSVPISVKSVLYIVVGAGLARSSRLLWTAWAKNVS